MEATTAGRQNAVPRRAASAFGGAVKLCVALGLPIVLLFGVAGRWDWPAAWAYMALLTSGMIAASVVFVKFQPGLAQERAAHWRDGKRWDRPFLLIIGVLGPVSVQLLCGLDKRFGWSGAAPLTVQAIAAAAFAGGVAITAWAMAVNPFFSATVRIQRDRGHTVVARGPYRHVRHPGYAGMLLVTFAGPLLLGTFWGLVPAAVVGAALAVRTVLEDRTLRAELAGYTDYVTRVRSRLVPGVW